MFSLTFFVSDPGLLNIFNSLHLSRAFGSRGRVFKDVYLVAVLHVDVPGRLVAAEALAVEEEAEVPPGVPCRRIRVEDLLELRRRLDLEEHVFALRHFVEAYIQTRRGGARGRRSGGLLLLLWPQPYCQCMRLQS